MTQASPHKIIIDTDPGIDDAMAIFTALAHPDIELLGLTTTFGNVSVEQATQNALTLVEMAGADIPVAKGVATPLINPLGDFPDFVHGADGFGELDLPAPNIQAVSQSAAEFIIQTVRQYPGEVTLVPIGPLGNLALALQLDPGITKLVKQVVWMGGVFATDGNVSPVAEANCFSDPHAADRVLQADWPVVVVGLDVTHQVVLSPELFQRIKSNNPKAGSFMHDAAQFYMRFYSGIRDIKGCYGHDVSAVAYVINPDLFGTESGAMRVVKEGMAMGQTIMGQPKIPYSLDYWKDGVEQKACMRVDDGALLALFEEAMTNGYWQ